MIDAESNPKKSICFCAGSIRIQPHLINGTDMDSRLIELHGRWKGLVRGCTFADWFAQPTIGTIRNGTDSNPPDRYRVYAAWTRSTHCVFTQTPHERYVSIRKQQDRFRFALFWLRSNRFGQSNVVLVLDWLVRDGDETRAERKLNGRDDHRRHTVRLHFTSKTSFDSN